MQPGYGCTPFPESSTNIVVTSDLAADPANCGDDYVDGVWLVVVKMLVVLVVAMGVETTMQVAALRCLL